jgi:prephenate dehydrogenase
MIGTLVVVGLGQIGGSIALAARARKAAKRIVGIETDPAHREAARGWVDDFAESAAGADLVAVAVPLPAIPEAAARSLAESPAAIVTDVGGLKTPVVKEVARRAKAAASRFVGGHPMAGNEKSGPTGADAALFEGRTVILTPARGVDASAVAAFWRALGAREVLEESPETHDRWMATVSHLPHLVAFALADQGRADCVKLDDVAGPSFESATRVAASDRERWADLILANRRATGGALEDFMRRLDEAAAAIRDGDRARLIEAIR